MVYVIQDSNDNYHTAELALYLNNRLWFKNAIYSATAVTRAP